MFHWLWWVKIIFVFVIICHVYKWQATTADCYSTLSNGPQQSNSDKIIQTRDDRRGLQTGPLCGVFQQTPYSNCRPISHRFHSAPTCHGRTDGQKEFNWSTKMQHYALKCISRKKCWVPETEHTSIQQTGDCMTLKEKIFTHCSNFVCVICIHITTLQQPNLTQQSMMKNSPRQSSTGILFCIPLSTVMHLFRHQSPDGSTASTVDESVSGKEGKIG